MLPEFSLEGKIAVVTGGARGLGAEMLGALAEAGADVVATDILGDLAHETATATGAKHGVRGAAYALDVTKPADVTATFAKIEAEFGPIDVLVASAGVVENIKAEDFSPEMWRHHMDVNLDGVFYCAQAAGRGMLARKRGSIVLIASMSGMIVNHPQPQSAYNASKAAVIHLARSLGAEWADRNVRVNSICPGYMRTSLTEKLFVTRPDLERDWNEQTPMHRMGAPSELRGPVVFLASEASSFATGSALVVDGGFTLW